MPASRLPPGATYFVARPNPRTVGHYRRCQLVPPLFVATALGIWRMTTFRILGWQQAEIRGDGKIAMVGHITHGEGALSRYDPASGLTLRTTLIFTRGATEETT